METDTSVIEVGLGHTTLGCRHADMSVQLTSSAHFAPSEKDDFDQLRQKLTTANLTDQARKKLWIRRDTSFKLVLSLHLDSLGDLHDKDEVVRILSEHMGAAKMWEQLHLEATSVSSTFDGFSGFYAITVHLDSHPSIPTSRSRLHKLGHDVPSVDVRPPSGITEALCKMVQIALVLRPHPDQNLDCSKTPGGIDWGSHSRSDMLSDSISLGDAVEDILPPNETSQPPHAPNQLDRLYEDDLFQQIVIADDHFDGTSIAADINNPRALCSFDGPSTCEAFSPSEAHWSAQDCAHMIETAVQSMICGPSCLRNSNLSVYKWQMQSPLMELLPSIFWPGYLPGLASKAVFIPTIAYALGSILRLKRHSTSHSQDFANASGESMSVSSGNGSVVHTGPAMLPSLLWAKLCNGLRSGAKAGRVRPMWEAVDQQEDKRDLPEQLLDLDDQCFDETDFPSDDCLCEEDGWCDMLDDHGDLDLLEEGILLGSGAHLSGDIEDDEHGHIGIEPMSENIHFRSTPDQGLDLAHGVSTCAWQCSNPLLPTSQYYLLPSQSHSRTSGTWFRHGHVEEEQTTEEQRKGLSHSPVQAGHVCTYEDRACDLFD